jgi:beta-1,4-mannosyl-glycoprotein beta-1,4-N-acetylglucosaminyltransferase
MIYDCITFFEEIDLLRFRLQYLDSHVDKFVIAEADSTFSGVKKPFNLPLMEKQIEPWRDKIIYLPIKIDNKKISSLAARGRVDSVNIAWLIEKIQRDALGRYFVENNLDGVCFFSDIDEVWNKDICADLAFIPPGSEFAARLSMKFYYFYFNLIGIGVANSSWFYPFVATTQYMRCRASEGVTGIRTGPSINRVLENAGWHFSYLGGVEAITRKLESFSHQELNNERYKSRAHLSDCLRSGKDPFFRRDHDWAFVHMNSFPISLREKMMNFPDYIKDSLIV